MSGTDLLSIGGAGERGGKSEGEELHFDVRAVRGEEGLRVGEVGDSGSKGG
jgi:hypothetical protein